MNRTLGLAVRRDWGWPTAFLDYGYRVLAIEADVHMGERHVAPDIVLLNEEAAHMLVVDCKGGANVDQDQDGRYSKMVLEELVEATHPPCEVVAHTMSYSTSEGNEARIRDHANFALVVFGHDSVRVNGHLGHDGPTSRLQRGVPLGGVDIPEEVVYPFSIHDSNDDIDYKVAGAVLTYLAVHPEMAMMHLANLEVARGVLAVAHPLHSHFSASHRRELARATKQGIARLEMSGGLDRILGALRRADETGREP